MIKKMIKKMGKHMAFIVDGIILIFILKVILIFIIYSFVSFGLTLGVFTLYCAEHCEGSIKYFVMISETLPILSVLLIAGYITAYVRLIWALISKYYGKKK